eukprot:scaffold1628_cov407-Prasinococcus_capsulatus_cf.AAC.15
MGCLQPEPPQIDAKRKYGLVQDCGNVERAVGKALAAADAEHAQEMREKEMELMQAIRDREANARARDAAVDMKDIAVEEAVKAATVSMTKSH